MARFKDNLNKLIEDLPRPLRWPVAICAVLFTMGWGAVLAGWLAKEGHPGLAGLAFVVWLILTFKIMGP